MINLKPEKIDDLNKDRKKWKETSLMNVYLDYSNPLEFAFNSQNTGYISEMLNLKTQDLDLGEIKISFARRNFFSNLGACYMYIF